MPKRDLAVIVIFVCLIAALTVVFLGTQPPTILSYISGNL